MITRAIGITSSYVTRSVMPVNVPSSFRPRRARKSWPLRPTVMISTRVLLALDLEDDLGPAADDVGVERSRQPTVGRHQQHAHRIDLALRQQRMQRLAAARACPASSAISARIASA